MNKVSFNDLFDESFGKERVIDSIELDIYNMWEKWNKEDEDKQKALLQEQEEKEHIKQIVREVLQEEISKIIKSSGLFGEAFCKQLEAQGFERNCPGCAIARVHYGTYGSIN